MVQKVSSRCLDRIYLDKKKIDFYTRNITKIISYKNYNLDKNNINMS